MCCGFTTRLDWIEIWLYHPSARGGLLDLSYQTRLACLRLGRTQSSYIISWFGGHFRFLQQQVDGFPIPHLLYLNGLVPWKAHNV